MPTAPDSYDAHDHAERIRERLLLRWPRKSGHRVAKISCGWWQCSIGSFGFGFGSICFYTFVLRLDFWPYLQAPWFTERSGVGQGAWR
jgi:hypothetical protein